MAESTIRPRRGITKEVAVDTVNKCIWCDREFTKLSTLAKHLCERKRRHNNQSLKHVQIGFQAFNKFYKVLQNTKVKTYIDFMNSPYYLAFIRLGHYVIDVNCFNVQSYIDWVIRNSVPIDKWNTDKIYSVWLHDWTYKEDHWDAANRSFETMADWAVEHKSVFNHYFKYATNSRIIADIQKGSISGWIVYCSDTGRNWLQSLNDSELNYVWDLVNSDKWQKKFKDYKEFYKDIKDLCRQAGL